MVCAPLCAHGGEQAFGAGIEPHAFGIGAFQRIERQTLQHAHPLAQRRLEFQLAAHGAFGDGGDPGLEARHVGQFVQAFDIDDGGIHVGDQQLLLRRAVATRLMSSFKPFSQHARLGQQGRGVLRIHRQIESMAPAKGYARAPASRAANNSGSAPAPMTFRTKADILLIDEMRRRAYCRPDRERQVCRRAGFGRAHRRRADQRRFHAGLSRKRPS